MDIGVHSGTMRIKLILKKLKVRRFQKVSYTMSHTTVEHGQLITKKYLGEHKVITAEQQFLGLILWFFMYLKWPWLLRLFAVLL